MDSQRCEPPRFPIHAGTKSNDGPAARIISAGYILCRVEEAGRETFGLTHVTHTSSSFFLSCRGQWYGVAQPAEATSFTDMPREAFVEVFEFVREQVRDMHVMVAQRRKSIGSRSKNQTTPGMNYRIMHGEAATMDGSVLVKAGGCWRMCGLARRSFLGSTPFRPFSGRTIHSRCSSGSFPCRSVPSTGWTTRQPAWTT